MDSKELLKELQKAVIFSQENRLEKEDIIYNFLSILSKEKTALEQLHRLILMSYHAVTQREALFREQNNSMNIQLCKNHHCFKNPKHIDRFNPIKEIEEIFSNELNIKPIFNLEGFKGGN